MFTQVFTFIYQAIKPFKLAISIMFAVTFLWSIDLSLAPYILKTIIDRISSNSNENIFASVGLLSLLYLFRTLIITSMYRVYDYFVIIKMIPSLRKNIANLSFGSLIEQSYSFYQNNFAGSLSNKVNDLISSVPEIIQIVIDQFASRILALIIATITLYYVNSVFAIIMLIWSMVFILGSLLISKKLSHLSDIWSESGSRITGKMVDSLSNIVAIKLFAKIKEEKATMAAAFNEATIAEQNFQWVYFWAWLVNGYSFVILQGANLYFLLKGREAGWITIGDFIVVLTINQTMVELLWQITQDLSTFSKLWGKVSQALRAINFVAEIQDSTNAKVLKVNKGEIKFDKVKFHYKGSEPLFEDKSITIKPGEKVGLVGYSGSGKTTFVNLILRLYEINQGRILIDDQDISKVTQASLHSNIGMIPQDPGLFHRSLIDNIRYSKMDASEEEVIRAAKNAHAHDFIMNIPENYNSLVGERGVKLSGGQRQRIAIARAFLKNAPILILDEATSQLDSITEKDIQDSLWALMQDKTTIVVAHRLSTLLHMDRILVFEKGKIIGDGSHKELLESEGLYRTLWNAQVGGFLPEK
jgi:ATP-binding cassette subfamily B protein